MTFSARGKRRGLRADWRAVGSIRGGELGVDFRPVKPRHLVSHTGVGGVQMGEAP